MRSIIIALGALALASGAYAGTTGNGWSQSPPSTTATPAASINLPAGPYKLDAKGKCHAANGQFVTASKCKPTAPASNHCKDPKTHKFTKCTAPGAVPA